MSAGESRTRLELGDGYLRFTPSQLAPRCNLGVVLCPGHAHLPRATAATERVGATEVAWVGQDLVLVGQDGRIEYQDMRLDALALLCVQGQCYALGQGGLSKEVDGGKAMAFVQS